jgi:hypothetical protein
VAKKANFGAVKICLFGQLEQIKPLSGGIPVS